LTASGDDPACDRKQEEERGAEQAELLRIEFQSAMIGTPARPTTIIVF